MTTEPTPPHSRPGGSGPVPAAARRPMPVLMVGQHVIAALLATVGVIRALGDGGSPVVAVLAGVCLLACYAAGAMTRAVRGSRSRAGLWLGLLTAIWVAALLVSPEFVWFAFLLWLLAGHLLPWLMAVGYSTGVFALVVAAPLWHHGVTSYANVAGPLIGGIFALGISRGYLRLLADAAERERLVASLRQAQQDMADLQDELALTQRHSGAMAERTRLAHDLHDTIAQSMSSIRLLAHAAIRDTGAVDPAATGAGPEVAAESPGAARRPVESRAAAGDPAVATLRQIESLAAEGSRDVRRIVAALAPAELEDGALAAALARMTQRLSEQSGIAVDLHVDGGIAALPAAVEVALLRTAQSALANVRLHSGAGRVIVSLVDDDDEVRLDIIDDGRGFDPAEPHGADAGARTGYGLAFMRSRLRQLGGGLDIESAPGEGVALSAHLPVRPREEGD